MSVVDCSPSLCTAVRSFEATFVVNDPARYSWFFLWQEQNDGPLFDKPANSPLGAAGLVPTELCLRRPVDGRRGTAIDNVAGWHVGLSQMVALATSGETAVDLTGSLRLWLTTIRFGLQKVVERKMLPSVSAEGWDTWRLDPLDVDDLEYLDRLVAALPATGNCVPTTDRRARITSPHHAVRQCLDAVADHAIRQGALSSAEMSTVFATEERLRVRHLEPWVRDVASTSCATAAIFCRLHPPSDRSDGQNLWSLVVEAQSHQDPSLVLPLRELSSLGPEVYSRFGDRVHTKALAALHTAAKISPVLKPLATQIPPDRQLLTDDELGHLLADIDVLKTAGISLQWPAELVRPNVKRRLLVTFDGDAGSRSGQLGIDRLIRTDWEFLLEDLALEPSELRLLANAKRRVVSLRGRWVQVDAALVELLTTPPPKLSAAQAIAAAAGWPIETVDTTTSPVEVVIKGDLADAVEQLQSCGRAPDAVEVATLQATLRPYQSQGVGWLIQLARAGLGACLADDMGLGKTVQILGLHAALTGTGPDPWSEPTLVVCPTSLITNWQKEAAKFLPNVPVRCYHGPRRSLDGLEPGSIVLTTYGVVRSDPQVLTNDAWGLIVADEAQNVKNPKSKTSLALVQIDGRSRVALSGTPIENHLTELWSIFSWIMPGLLGSLDLFRHRLAWPIEKNASAEATRQLHQLIDPFLLRRRKTDPGIAPELPPKIERDERVGLTEEQVTLYRAAVDTALADLAEVEGFERHGHVFRLLTALKQITNHPAQFLGQTGPIPNRSAKLGATERIVQTAADGGESTLVFTQFVTMGNLLVEHFRRLGHSIAMLCGSQSIEQRQQLVERFQAGKLNVLVLSIKAGGTGLNLTQATQVIHYDRWWNPAVEDQATDRAYRIGQPKPVTVHRMRTVGTIEDRVAELLANKRDLAERVLSPTASWVSSLDQDELKALVTLKGDPS